MNSVLLGNAQLGLLSKYARSCLLFISLFKMPDYTYEILMFSERTLYIFYFPFRALQVKYNLFIQFVKHSKTKMNPPQISFFKSFLSHDFRK